jgi:hypothetical protein
MSGANCCIPFPYCYEGTNYIKFLNDGTVWTVDSPPVEVTDQTIIDGLVLGFCQPDAFEDMDTETLVFTPGQTVPFAVTLSDGTALAAGDPVPAGAVVISEVEFGTTNLIRYESFVIPPASVDTNHTPEYYVPGDTVAVAFTAEDGTVYNVGDVIPPGLWVFLELDTAGALVEANTLTVPVIPMSCLCNVQYVDYDPATHVAGPVVGYGSTGSPFQVPLFDPCAWKDGAALDPCTVTGLLGTDGTDCGLVDPSELFRDHIKSQCVAVAELVDTFDAAAEDVTLTMTEQDTGQIGTSVLGGQNVDAIPAAQVQPYTVTLPASTPGCLQFIQISHGADTFGGNQGLAGSGAIGPAGWTLATVPTGDITNETVVMDEEFNYIGAANNTRMMTDVYGYEVTGTGGGSVDFTFPSAPANPDNDAYDGVLHHVVYEVCPSTGSITLADFGSSQLAEANVPNPMEPGTGYASNTVDGGSCDALFFGASRHALGLNDDGTQNSPDGDWSTPSDPAVVEVTDRVTVDDSDNCQMGATAGIIAGGSGPVSFTYNHNHSATFNTFDINPWAVWNAIPFTACSQAGGPGSARTAKCNQSLVNDCGGDAELTIDVSTSVTLTVPTGASICVSPVVNGTVVATEVTGCDNTAGTSDVVITLPAGFAWVDPALVAADGTGMVEVCYEVTDKNGTGDVTAQFTDVVVDAELTHV